MGKLDLVVANLISSVSVLLNTSAAGATTVDFAVKQDFATGDGPRSVSVGDLNEDGKLDLANVNFNSNNVAVLLNTTAPGGAVLGDSSKATVTINDNDTVNGPNPIDQTDFLVRQLYIDFLGREPDPAGFAGWTSTINNCVPGDTSCDRIHVSQLFYQSDEFQARGYYVFKFYPVSFPGIAGVDPPGAGHKPDYAVCAGCRDRQWLFDGRATERRQGSVCR